MRETVQGLRERVVKRAVSGPGSATTAARCAAFHNRDVDVRAQALVDKVASRAWTVTGGDVAAAKAAGLSDDEIFELVVCAALGQATRQLDTALAALNAADDGGSR
jgi:alkylhydroperoxidase/carboxymuconolactone decarboxylase family protein YurZ